MKKILAVLFCALLIGQTGYAAPVVQEAPAQEKSYGKKVGDKFVFGLKNSLLGWTAMFSEPFTHKYDLDKTAWEGFCNGIAKTVFYTANGVIHLATFPIPVNVPDMGEGVLPNLGEKKGPPPPWEVHGKSKFSIVPASEVVEPPEPTLMPTATPEMLHPAVQVPLAKKIPTLTQPTTSRLPVSKPVVKLPTPVTPKTIVKQATTQKSASSVTAIASRIK